MSSSDEEELLFLLAFQCTSAPTAGFLDAERVLQRLRGIRQDDATETGRRATPQTIVDIVRNRTLK